MISKRSNSPFSRLFLDPAFLKERVGIYVEMLWDLSNNVAELKHYASIRSSETVINHLAKIGVARQVDPDELSYALSYVSRSLDLQPPSGSGSKDLAVCTVAFGDDYRRRVKACLDSQESYCAKNGYAYARLVTPPSRLNRHPSWYKIPLLHKLTQLGYKNVAFIDADALVTNPAISLQPFFDLLAKEKKVLHVAEDDDGVNMGVFFLRNCPDAIRLLDLLWLHDNPMQVWEQAALRTLLDHYIQIRRLVSIAPTARAFNSFPPERAAICRARQTNNWAPGDFICHFSGITETNFDRLLSKYVDQLSVTP